MSDLVIIVYLTLLSICMYEVVKEGSLVEGDEVNFWVEVEFHVAHSYLLIMEVIQLTQGSQMASTSMSRASRHTVRWIQ
jgi:hypothetical protein